MGFAGALRRSELVGLNVEDLDFTWADLVATLRRSKTDQDGDGRKLGVPWLPVAAITTGPVFREITKADRIIDPYTDKKGRPRGARLGDKAVALIVKQATRTAGLDPTRYAGHSLRAGLATSAAAAGASERAIMATTGHRSVQMVRRYIRSGELFRENAAATVGRSDCRCGVTTVVEASLCRSPIRRMDVQHSRPGGDLAQCTPWFCVRDGADVDPARWAHGTAGRRPRGLD